MNRIDTETNLSIELIDAIDKILFEIIRNEHSVEYLDMMGYLDSAENLIGLGFVACQTYITTVCGVLSLDKKKALSFGPIHQSGKSIAQIVNDAANYWKHSNEWKLAPNSKRQRKIENSFEKIGVPLSTSYTLSRILTELAAPNPISLKAVFLNLITWGNEIQESSS